MRFCVMCGQQLTKNSVFCECCGTRVEPVACEAVQEEETAVPETVIGEVTLPEEEFYETASPKQVSEEQKVEKASPFTHLAAVCACILIFFVLATGTVIFTVRGSTTEDAVSAVVNEISIADIRVGSMMNADDSDLTLAEYIHDSLDEELVSRYNLSEGNIEELLEEEEIKDFLSEKLSEYCDYIYSGGSEPKVTAKEIVKLLEKNEKTIYRITGYQLGENDYEEIRETLGDGQLGMLDMSNVSEEYGSVLTMLKIGLSYWLLAVLAVIAVLLCVLVFMLYRRRIVNAFLAVGAALLAAGLAGFAVSLFSDSIARALCDLFSFPQEAVKPIVKHLFLNLLQLSAVVLITGIIFVVIRIGVGIWQGKIRKHVEE